MFFYSGLDKICFKTEIFHAGVRGGGQNWVVDPKISKKFKFWLILEVVPILTLIKVVLWVQGTYDVTFGFIYHITSHNDDVIWPVTSQFCSKNDLFSRFLGLFCLFWGCVWRHEYDDVTKFAQNRKFNHMIHIKSEKCQNLRQIDIFLYFLIFFNILAAILDMTS